MVQLPPSNVRGYFCSGHVVNINKQCRIATESEREREREIDRGEETERLTITDRLVKQSPVDTEV